MQASSKAKEIPEDADDDDALEILGGNIDETDDTPEDQTSSEKMNGISISECSMSSVS